MWRALWYLCLTKAPRCSKDDFEEQLSRFQVFPVLAEGLIPKSSLGFWLVSGIMQYDPILEFRGFRFNTDKIQKRTDTETVHAHACTHTHTPSE